MLADYHVHTQFSGGSTYPVEQAARDAAALGLNGICITSHVDYGVKADWDSGKEGLFWRRGELGDCE